MKFTLSTILECFNPNFKFLLAYSEQIKDLMQEFASRHIIPYMEQKVRDLNQQVGFRFSYKLFLRTYLVFLYDLLVFCSLSISFSFHFFVPLDFCNKERTQKPDKELVVEKRKRRYSGFNQRFYVCSLHLFAPFMISLTSS